MMSQSAPNRRARLFGAAAAIMFLFVTSCSAAPDTTATATDTTATDRTATDTTATDTAEAVEPTPEPTAEPTPEPAVEPTTQPTPLPTPVPTAAPVDPTAEPADEAAGSGSSEVVLIDAGVEPRVPLRIDLAPTCTELLIMEQTQELVQSIGGTEMSNPGPLGTIMRTRISARAVGSGNYLVTSEIVDAEPAPSVPPELNAVIAEGLEAVLGLRTSVEVTNRGLQVPGTMAIEGQDALGPFADTVEGLSQVVNPFPEEAVGIGAQWQTTSVIELEGLAVTTRTTNTITNIDGSIVTIDVVSDQSVPDDSVMEVPGGSAEVLQWDMSGVGTAVLDMQSIVPVMSEVETTGVQVFDLGPGQELEQELTIEIEAAGELESGCGERPGRTRP